MSQAQRKEESSVLACIKTMCLGITAVKALYIYFSSTVLLCRY